MAFPPEMIPDYKDYLEIATVSPRVYPMVSPSALVSPPSSSVLIQPNQVATPNQISSSVLDYVMRQGAQPIRATTQPEQDENDGQPTMTEAVVVIGGTLVILHYTDRMIKSLFYQAAYNSDERIMRLFPEKEGFLTNIWRALGTGLSRFWVPLWFSQEEIRERAVRQALDNAFTDVRVRRIEDLRRLEDARNLDQAQNPVVPVNNINNNNHRNNRVAGNNINAQWQEGPLPLPRARDQAQPAGLRRAFTPAPDRRQPRYEPVFRAAAQPG